MGAFEVIRVVLDTNVLVSGLLFGGTPGKLVDLWKTGRIQLLMSREMLDELLKVLAYPKLQLSEAEIQYLLYVEVLPYIEMVRVRPGPVVVAQDPSDDMFLHCALTAAARYIVSGDRHLLNLKTHRRIKILFPAQFLSTMAS
jgi:putative PIN family toxin of toxin-antitoxin system